jgi:hypothetical protein
LACCKLNCSVADFCPDFWNIDFVSYTEAIAAAMLSD